MSYYWFNREKILKYAWKKYHNEGGKKYAAKYYAAKIEILREDARDKYRRLPKTEEDKKKEISKSKIPHEY